MWSLRLLLQGRRVVGNAEPDDIGVPDAGVGQIAGERAAEMDAETADLAVFHGRVDVRHGQGSGVERGSGVDDLADDDVVGVRQPQGDRRAFAAFIAMVDHVGQQLFQDEGQDKVGARRQLVRVAESLDIGLDRHDRIDRRFQSHIDRFWHPSRTRRRGRAGGTHRPSQAPIGRPYQQSIATPRQSVVGVQPAVQEASADPHWTAPGSAVEGKGGGRHPGIRGLLARQRPHGVVEAVEGERIHPVADQLADQLDRHGVLPVLLRHRVDPREPRIGAHQPLQPDLAGLLVPVLHRAAGHGDLVRAHRGVADHHHLGISRIGVQQVPGRDALGMAPPVVGPHPLVEAVVEVEVVERLELHPGGGEQLLADPDVVVHGAADVEEEQHLHRVAAFRPHLDVEEALLGGGLDGVVEGKFLGGARAGEAAQAAQRDLDGARADLDGVVVVLEVAPVPDLHRAAVAAPVLADAHAFRVVAVGAERGGAGRADPFGSALVAALLLGEPLLQRLHQLLEAAERLDLGLLRVGQEFFGQLADPLLGDLRLDRVADGLQPLEGLREDPVEAVDVCLVLHQQRARQIVEILYPLAGQIGLQRLHQGEVLAQRHRHASALQVVEEGQEHRCSRGIRTAASLHHPDADDTVGGDGPGERAGLRRAQASCPRGWRRSRGARRSGGHRRGSCRW